MTAAQFIACGEACYGPSWQRPLALSLGLDERTIRRYARSESPVPSAVRERLSILLAERSTNLSELATIIS